VIFALTALHTGDFTVGANVQRYDSADCSGTPTPKTPNTIQVQVQVCSLCYVKPGIATLGATTWQAFTHFWAWLIGALFATLIVIINRWRRRRFSTRLTTTRGEGSTGPSVCEISFVKAQQFVLGGSVPIFLRS
jgi:hypothetical protein